MPSSAASDEADQSQAGRVGQRLEDADQLGQGDLWIRHVSRSSMSIR
jgi:hypothetical protein